VELDTNAFVEAVELFWGSRPKMKFEDFAGNKRHGEGCV
jgi:hypothetical protein